MIFQRKGALTLIQELKSGWVCLVGEHLLSTAGVSYHSCLYTNSFLLPVLQHNPQDNVIALSLLIGVNRVPVVFP